MNEFEEKNFYPAEEQSGAEETVEIKPEYEENVLPDTDADTVGTIYVEAEEIVEESQEPQTEQEQTPTQIVPFSETVKKKQGFKRYIAIAVAAAIVNLAALGGLFAAGYNLGLRGKGGTSNVLANLNTGAENTGGAKETVVKGEELTTVEISKKVGPAVVGITSKIQSAMSFFNTPIESEGTGSGIIISSDGYIVTNNHVIEGASSVSVTLNTGAEYEAKVIGTDSRTDLAVIKITPNEQLTVAELGDSSAIEVGERAIAIGNPLGMEFFGSTTQGIISAINRTITVDNRTLSVIQTDAAINEGNSGGALVNAYGQVIGINAVKISSSTVEGMGFAIPISEAKPVLEDLIKHGYVKGRPVIGISSRDVTEYMANRQGWPVGIQVMGTQVGSGAEIAGLQQGDIITKIDGQRVATTDELNKIKNTRQVGENIALEVYKYETGLTQTVMVKLSEERPE